MAQINRKKNRNRVHYRIRKKISGTSERPRLAVHFSNKNVYAQLINDVEGKTIASASTKDKKGGLSNGANSECAAKVGTMIADRAKSAGIEKVVFDRGGFLYSQKVKALADAAREAGLQF
ncbi:MAG: 50S ribosomal protein L18 [Verrucomicrobiaceae bacterium]|nr:50S ribosomal protein L18 [Verrucomicrobiaceae bacterium]